MASIDIISVRPSNLDDPGISYFIERGKGKNLHISLYITIEDEVEDDIVYGFERDSINLTSINYWIQESITSNKLPDLSDWEEVKRRLKEGYFWKRGNERCTFAHSAYSSCPRD